MRILAKKAFQFDHPTSAEPSVKVEMQSFTDVPDWVPQSTMFKLASQDDDIMVIESKQDEAQAEIAVADGKGSKNKSNPDGTTTQP